ncbi:hypothetical protein [Flavobacterium branchiicola]|uniref:Lipoprotein n=1 Tax=Flavobacterium branchiicola TaxID=1114875 RepID=A0ABV9PAM6_9FLAO|nr:hypothetical protein [Flavobacterium branchiicola]MBS7253209.1 hypothetical protein [Flavobacterium branchiicola]
MRKITIFLILIITGCSKNDCSNNEKIRKIETDKIVETLLQQKYFENSKDSYTVCCSLKKLQINTESIYAEPTKKIEIVKLPPRLPRILENTEIYIEKLLNANSKGKKLFQIKDSINFVEQNNCFLKHKLSQNISKKLKTISVSKIEKASNYIILSIPIFSEDNQKAYIEIDCYPKKDQYGVSVYLEKKDNIWKIKDIKSNWSQCSG